ncbi:hypothetical protein SAMN04488564_108304 [Lentzea waywayandensis]|uniref:Uncharacterized protein n=1 Tax=Lentzea waywayandensis TaxID=84724 RepID=A0A1I6F6B0_9PSEU|nr:hypothetical protein [Lentzea waywayandensis]SFR25307.1 hypothetical protein SAMN04488564_108304 [Lentzea waywayandensis]
MKIPAWAVLGIGSLAALTVVVHAPVLELKGLDGLCSQPGARCGTQPDWYTGQERYETLRGVEMSARLPGVEVVYDYSLLWVVAAAVLVWAIVRRTWPAFATAALFGLTVWLRPSYSAYLLIVAAAVAVLYEHRHRWLRRGQANG